MKGPGDGGKHDGFSFLMLREGAKRMLSAISNQLKEIVGHFTVFG
jgi:hypothetical protein